MSWQSKDNKGVGCRVGVITSDDTSDRLMMFFSHFTGEPCPPHPAPVLKLCFNLLIYAASRKGHCALIDQVALWNNRGYL